MSPLASARPELLCRAKQREQGTARVALPVVAVQAAARNRLLVQLLVAGDAVRAALLVAQRVVLVVGGAVRAALLAVTSRAEPAGPAKPAER
jgi:hypothetical protein